MTDTQLETLYSQLNEYILSHFEFFWSIVFGILGITGKPFGYYYVSGDDLVDGMPTDERVWWFLWYVASGLWAFQHATNTIWRAEFTNGLLYDWHKIATATPPQEYDLPLAEGLIQSSLSWYSTDQFNLVHFPRGYTA